jgi:hypothetical protein
LGVFDGKNLEWNYFIGSGAAWNSPKHALKAEDLKGGVREEWRLAAEGAAPYIGRRCRRGPWR